MIFSWSQLSRIKCFLIRAILDPKLNLNKQGRFGDLPWHLVSIGLNFMVVRNGLAGFRGRKCLLLISCGSLNYLTAMLQQTFCSTFCEVCMSSLALEKAPAKVDMNTWGHGKHFSLHKSCIVDCPPRSALCIPSSALKSFVCIYINLFGFL